MTYGDLMTSNHPPMSVARFLEESDRAVKELRVLIADWYRTAREWDGEDFGLGGVMLEEAEWLQDLHDKLVIQQAEQHSRSPAQDDNFSSEDARYGQREERSSKGSNAQRRINTRQERSRREVNDPYDCDEPRRHRSRSDTSPDYQEHRRGGRHHRGQRRSKGTLKNMFRGITKSVHRALHV